MRHVFVNVLEEIACSSDRSASVERGPHDADQNKRSIDLTKTEYVLLLGHILCRNHIIAGRFCLKSKRFKWDTSSWKTSGELRSVQMFPRRVITEQSCKLRRSWDSCGSPSWMISGSIFAGCPSTRSWGWAPSLPSPPIGLPPGQEPSSRAVTSVSSQWKYQ